MVMIANLKEPIDPVYLVNAGLALDDIGRLDALDAVVGAAGFYTEATTGESRLLDEGEAVPGGTWVSQRDIDDIKRGRAEDGIAARPGEGFGSQTAQLGGDRSYPEEDSGGTRRVPHDSEESRFDSDATPGLATNP